MKAVIAAEELIYSIIGSTRPDVRPLAYAVDIAAELIFVRQAHKSDIRVTRDIYPKVAEDLNKTSYAAARSIQQMAGRLWDSAQTRGMLTKLFGRSLTYAPAPSDIMFYLAYYCHHGRAFLSDRDDLDRLNHTA